MFRHYKWEVFDFSHTKSKHFASGKSKFFNKYTKPMFQLSFQTFDHVVF